MTDTQTYLSDIAAAVRAVRNPLRQRSPPIAIQGNVKAELNSKRLSAAEAVAILEDMLVIRELEEMIVKLRSGAYEPIRDYDYRGPTHVSIGQEGTAAGACCGAAPRPTTSPAPTAATARAWRRAPSPSAR